MSVDLSGGLDPSKELVLAECPDNPEIRDAVNVWIEQDNGDFAMRIGIEALAAEWEQHDVWLDLAFTSGRVLNFRGNGERHGELDESGQATIRSAGPIRFQCLEPFAVWKVSFNGTVSELTALGLAREQLPVQADITKLEFDIELRMVVPPWTSGTLLAESTAIMGGEQGAYMSPRYEQLFTASGWLYVDGERKVFKGRGLRIRRQGVRQFEGFWGHCWQSAVFPSGKGFGFCVYPPKEGMPNFNEGFVFDGENRIPARAINIPWLDRLQVKGDDVSFALETVDGERVSVQGETFINTRSIYKGQTILPPNFPIVQQAHAVYTWDGEKTCGMVERSSTPSLITYRE